MTVYSPIHLCYNMFLARTGIAVNLQPWYRLQDIEAKNIGTCGMFLREPSCSLHLSSAYILPFAPFAGINAPFAKCLVWALKPSLGVGHMGRKGHVHKHISIHVLASQSTCKFRDLRMINYLICS